MTLFPRRSQVARMVALEESLTIRPLWRFGHYDG